MSDTVNMRGKQHMSRDPRVIVFSVISRESPGVIVARSAVFEIALAFILQILVTGRLTACIEPPRNSSNDRRERHTKCGERDKGLKMMTGRFRLAG